MIRTSIEKLAEEIGFDIGVSDDNAQSKLLNGLCKGLANSMNAHDLDTQICYIVDKLDNKSCAIIKQINEFIKLKENNNLDH